MVSGNIERCNVSTPYGTEVRGCGKRLSFIRSCTEKTAGTTNKVIRF